jgi:putative protein kinase ArgK-like GTPase of G3E family
LTELRPHAGRPRRIGIGGVPGVGKATFIDAFGTMLTGLGHRVAVLAVDPSSTRTGGSILGNKTRMERLSVDPAAFVRPFPSAGTLGGVAKATRESIIVMEAAGYDVVLVETVGGGQSETTVAGMVDSFLLLSLARTGDGLQGIKKGVWRRWNRVEQHRVLLEAGGRLASKRAAQQVGWTWSMVRDELLERLGADWAVRNLSPTLEASVRAARSPPPWVADRVLSAFGGT